VPAASHDPSDDEIPEQPAAPNRPKLFVAAPVDAAPTGLAAWKAARAAALATLKQLEKAYRGFDHPDADEGIILLRAIQANLTPEPATKQQVDELENYIAGDDILVEAEEPNGFGIAVKLREPLLAALASVRASMAGGAGQ
jgi:hypothetical protein